MQRAHVQVLERLGEEEGLLRGVMFRDGVVHPLKSTVAGVERPPGGGDTQQATKTEMPGEPAGTAFQKTTRRTQ